jgi:hypothetical protein
VHRLEMASDNWGNRWIPAIMVVGTSVFTLVLIVSAVAEVFWGHRLVD